MIEPPPPAAINGTACLQTSAGPFKLTSSARFHSSSFYLCDPADARPARIVDHDVHDCRNCLHIPAASLRQSSSSATSATTIAAVPPPPSMIFSVSAALPSSRSARITRAPWRAKRTAVADPDARRRAAARTRARHDGRLALQSCFLKGGNSVWSFTESSATRKTSWNVYGFG